MKIFYTIYGAIFVLCIIGIFQIWDSQKICNEKGGVLVRDAFGLFVCVDGGLK